jgi:hypothetical protein
VFAGVGVQMLFTYYSQIVFSLAELVIKNRVCLRILVFFIVITLSDSSSSIEPGATSKWLHLVSDSHYQTLWRMHMRGAWYNVINLSLPLLLHVDFPYHKFGRWKTNKQTNNLAVHLVMILISPWLEVSSSSVFFLTTFFVFWTILWEFF